MKYFPLLRGRQYDLLALKELANGKLLSKDIFPIVEPIKYSTTLKSMIKSFCDNDFNIGIVINSKIGELSKDEISQVIVFCKNPNVYPVLYEDSSILSWIDMCKKEQVLNRFIIIESGDKSFDVTNSIKHDLNILYTVLTNQSELAPECCNQILLVDRFNKKHKNADYAKNSDEFFAPNYFDQNEMNLFGFSDYTIVGKKNEDSGFAPRAVAIHIVYLSNDNTLRIHHFVSDSNVGMENIAGKYYEAVNKLKKWYDNRDNYMLCETPALRILLSHADSGYYPGLAILKKLSIMHHFEIITELGKQSRCSVV